MTHTDVEAKSPSLIHGADLSSEPGLGALTLPGYLREVTTLYGEREALVMRHADGVERWSYNELWNRSMQVARSLVAIGVGKDSRVGILMTNRPELLSSVFGTALAGGVAVMLNTFSTPVELEYMVQASSIAVLLYEGKVLKKNFSATLLELEPAIATSKPGQLNSGKFPFLRYLAQIAREQLVKAPAEGAVEHWTHFLARGEIIPPALVSAMAASVLPADAGALFFSSGSTARPKGILNSQRGITIQAWRMRRLYGLTGDVRTWTPNGFFWSGNFATVLGTNLSCGGSLVLQSSFVASEALELMQAERVNFPVLWPHQAKQLVEAPNWNDVDLSAIYFLDPSSPLSKHPTIRPNSWEQPTWSYGSTETFTLSTSYPLGTPHSVSGNSHGEALPGNTLKIVDPDTGAILPRGEHGEIAVKGPTLMMGYLGIPSEEAFDDEGFFRTGDGGYIDETTDRLFWTGRLTTVIKTGGANVSPLEIDAVLESFPGVKTARTVGVPHDTLGEVVVACIVALDGAVVDASALLAFAKQRLASYKVPRHVLFVREDELALTGSAKIKAGELRKLATQRLEVQADQPAA